MLLYSDNIRIQLFTCVSYLKVVELNRRNMFWGSNQMKVMCLDFVFNE